MPNNWNVPSQGDTEKALQALINNDQKLHKNVPEKLDTSATLSDVVAKVNELIGWLKN